MSQEKVLFAEIEKKSKEIVKQEVESFIPNKTFNISDCDFLISKLTEKIGNKLTSNSNNFKYIINIIFLENSNKGFTQNIMTTYDPDTDGVISMHFPYKNITCIVNLMILSI